MLCLYTESYFVYVYFFKKENLQNSISKENPINEFANSENIASHKINSKSTNREDQVDGMASKVYI